MPAFFFQVSAKINQQCLPDILKRVLTSYLFDLPNIFLSSSNCYSVQDLLWKFKTEKGIAKQALSSFFGVCYSGPSSRAPTNSESFRNMRIIFDKQQMITLGQIIPPFSFVMPGFSTAAGTQLAVIPRYNLFWTRLVCQSLVTLCPSELPQQCCKPVVSWMCICSDFCS